MQGKGGGGCVRVSEAPPQPRPEQDSLFRSLEPGDSQPGREVGPAAGAAQLLQGAGCFGLSLLPILVLGEILHDWRFSYEPWPHSPKTHDIWLS